MEPAAFPAEGRARRSIPSSFALETAMERPLALKVPVGMIPSSFTQRSGRPTAPPSLSTRVRGVQPSPRETTFFLSFTGRSSQ